MSQSNPDLELLTTINHEFLVYPYEWCVSLPNIKHHYPASAIINNFGTIVVLLLSIMNHYESWVSSTNHS